MPAVRLYSEVGASRTVDTAHAMGISDLNEIPVSSGFEVFFVFLSHEIESQLKLFFRKGGYRFASTP